MSSIQTSELKERKGIITPVDEDQKLSAAASFDAEEHVEFSKWCVKNEKIIESIENQHFFDLKGQRQA